MNTIRSLSIVIPTHNNEATISLVVNDALQVASTLSRSFEIVVCNDGSVDRTGDIIRTLQKKHTRVRSVTHRQNQGYGQTIKELYYEAKNEWIFSVPGDYQVLPEEMRKLLPFIDSADMILGWRVERHDPEQRLMQSNVYNRLLRLLFSLGLHDVNSVRLMKTAMVKHIALTSTSAFVDAELAIQATKMGYHIQEVPIAHRKEEGKGSGGNLRTILPTIGDMMRTRFFL